MENDKTPAMQATLSFNLSDIDGKNNFESCLKAKNYELALMDIYNMLRTYHKYEYREAYDNEDGITSKELTEEEYKLVKQIYTRFFDILNYRGANCT